MIFKSRKNLFRFKNYTSLIFINVPDEYVDNTRVQTLPKKVVNLGRRVEKIGK